MESISKKYQKGKPHTLINSLIVDDEMGAINTLTNMLGQYCPQVSILDAVSSVKEAIKAAVKLKPDIVFLDIEMSPLGSGFDFLHNCPYTNFGVIFTTAYPKYAIKAINEVQPWAYLVKPYSVAELREAVNTAYDKWRHHVNFDFQTAGLQRVVINDSRKGSMIFRADSIAYCKAAGGFTEIYIWRNGAIEKIVSSNNLGEYESEFSRVLFCRPHHSYIVNMTYIDRFEKTGRNGVIYLTIPGCQVEVSVSKMEQFSNDLKEFCELRAQ